MSKTKKEKTKEPTEEQKRQKDRVGSGAPH
jgi:hypothetical protein